MAKVGTQVQELAQNQSAIAQAVKGVDEAATAAQDGTPKEFTAEQVADHIVQALDSPALQGIVLQPFGQSVRI